MYFATTVQWCDVRSCTQLIVFDPQGICGDRLPTIISKRWTQSLVCSLEDLSAPFRLRVVLAVQQNDTEIGGCADVINMQKSVLLQLMLYVSLCPKLNY